MLGIIFACFGLALVSIAGHRIAPRAIGWLLGPAAAGITVWLAGYAPAVWRGEVIQSSRAWFPGLDIRLAFQLDGLSLAFGLLIAGIGALILIYAQGYLSGHAGLGRLNAWLTAFMGSMLGVVFADDMLTLFVFWELTSLTSYFLIGAEHERASARSAALQALLVTGGGGLALLAGLVLLGWISGGYELSLLTAQRSAIISHSLYIPILLLILLGAFTKSAQFPFHFWLPNAMEAPTPVSAYLHSATMVKAGVYLLARLAPSMGGTPAWQALVTGFGTVTLLVGAVLALGQTDLKRILAYSTVSMLGALTLLVGIGTPAAAKAVIVLLVAHALYKAALFLVAGAVDHEAGTRDIRNLGGLKSAMPITATAAMLAAASNAGLPFMFGFIAKESLYEAVTSMGRFAEIVTLVVVTSSVLLFVVAGVTGWRPFVGAATAAAGGAHEAPLCMWLGPVVLSSIGVVLGIMPGLMDAMAASGARAIHGAHGEVHLAWWHGFNLVLLLSVVTFGAGLALYRHRQRLREKLEQLDGQMRWGPARAYEVGLKGLIQLAGWQTRILQSGYLRVYLLTIILAMLALVGWAVVRMPGWSSLPGWAPVRFHEWVLVLLIVCGTVVAVRSESRLAAVAALGTVGYGVAMIFVLHGAPDLAMTQFAIETLTVVLFVLVLYRLPRFTRFTRTTARLRDLIVASAGGALITLVLLLATRDPLEADLANYFIEHSLPMGKGRNVVNVILVDFRALDTLGEITVLAVAAIGVASLMRLRMEKGDRS